MYRVFCLGFKHTFVAKVLAKNFRHPRCPHSGIIDHHVKNFKSGLPKKKKRIYLNFIFESYVQQL